MINFDGKTISGEGTALDLIVESEVIIEEIFKELDPIQQYIFMFEIMKTFVTAKDKEVDNE